MHGWLLVHDHRSNFTQHCWKGNMNLYKILELCLPDPSTKGFAPLSLFPLWKTEMQDCKTQSRKHTSVDFISL